MSAKHVTKTGYPADFNVRLLFLSLVTPTISAFNASPLMSPSLLDHYTHHFGRKIDQEQDGRTWCFCLQVSVGHNCKLAVAPMLGLSQGFGVEDRKPDQQAEEQEQAL